MKIKPFYLSFKWGSPIVLIVILFLSLSIVEKNYITWSEPEKVFIFPSEPDEREYDAFVYGKNIRIFGSYRYLKEDFFFENSKLFFLEQGIDGGKEILSVPTEGFPSEQPSLLSDASGNVHLLWGDRRQDPEFEKWTRDTRRQTLGFSTNIIHSVYNGTQFTPPESIYEGHLREFVGGVGDIFLPVQLTEDSQGYIHAVFVADSTFAATTPEGEEVTGWTQLATHMRRSPSGEWSEPRYLWGGVEPDIAALPDNRLVAAYLGDAYPGQEGFHNVQVVVSDDNGMTWSDPQTIFFSGEQPGRMLRLETGADGSVHLIWGRQTRGLPLPNELWHSYSEDGGDAWSQPERFFVPEQSAQVENFIDSFDLVIDEFGRVHSASVKVTRQQLEGFIYYAMWNPMIQSWESPHTYNYADAERRRVNISLDETTNKLYLFWIELDEPAIYYSEKELAEPVTPPGVAVSGPLQLHANYPNPFNSSTQITFTLEEQAEVDLMVYDMSGRKVLRRELGAMQAGMHSEEVNLQGYASGTYIYEIALNGTWRQQSTMMYIR
jgi:hypothetical protein